MVAIHKNIIIFGHRNMFLVNQLTHAFAIKYYKQNGDLYIQYTIDSTVYAK